MACLKNCVGFLGNVSHVRRQNHIFERAQRVIDGQGLGLENVERGPSNAPGAKDVNQRVFVDQRTPSGIHEACGRFHQRELPRRNDAVSAVRKTQMQRDHIALSEQIVERRVGRSRRGGLFRGEIRRSRPARCIPT